MVLPDGFALPPLPYLLVLALALAGVAVGLFRRDVAFGGQHVLALIPWMVTGSALHVLYVLEAAPALLRPLFGTPAVYGTVAAVAGAIWIGADVLARSDPQSPGGTDDVTILGGIDDVTVLGAIGSVTALGAILAVGTVGVARGSIRLLPSLSALVIGIVLTGVAWTVLRRIRPDIEDVGWVGVLALGAHALDGVSTAVGVDWLGFGERTPLSQAIIEFGAGLPTAGVLGDAWLFVLVKVVLVAWIVTAFVEYVREKPAEGYGLLGLVAAVGLGPAVHNLLLFAVA